MHRERAKQSSCLRRGPPRPTSSASGARVATRWAVIARARRAPGRARSGPRHAPPPRARAACGLHSHSSLRLSALGARVSATVYYCSRDCVDRASRRIPWLTLHTRALARACTLVRTHYFPRSTQRPGRRSRPRSRSSYTPRDARWRRRSDNGALAWQRATEHVRARCQVAVSARAPARLAHDEPSCTRVAKEQNQLGATPASGSLRGVARTLCVLATPP